MIKLGSNVHRGNTILVVPFVAIERCARQQGLNARHPSLLRAQMQAIPSTGKDHIDHIGPSPKNFIQLSDIA